MNNQLTKSNPGSIIEQNQTNVQEPPWTWWFDFVKRCWKSPSNKGKQTPLAKSERPMLKNIKTNPNPNSSFGNIRQGSILKNLVILRSNWLTHFVWDWDNNYYWAEEQQTSWVIAPWWLSVSPWRICITLFWPRSSLKLTAPSSRSERHLHFASLDTWSVGR